MQIAGTLPVISETVRGSEEVGARSNLFGSGLPVFLLSSYSNTASTFPVFSCLSRVEVRPLFGEAAVYSRF